MPAGGCNRSLVFGLSAASSPDLHRSAQTTSLLDAEMFEQLAANNVFALHWHAHGFSYGLPPIINEWMAKGCTVIANGSRAVLQEARSRFPNLHVVNITAPPEIIAARLQARGRESGTMISDRLARAESVDIAESATHEIDNSGSLEAGGEALIRALLAIRGARAPTT